MTKWAAILAVVAAVVFASPAVARPVFDCSDDTVATRYPAQCPAPADPFLTPAHGGAGGHNDGCTSGLCGLVRSVINSIPGLGGIHL